MSDLTQINDAVLYVDDEALARKYFARSFGGHFDILTAEDAEGALRILKESPGRIGVIVTDFRMPGRNGADLLRQLDAEYPQLIRILVTAHAEKEILVETINAGEIFRVLEKPLNVPETNAILRIATDRARERRIKRERLAAMEETLGFLAHELNTPLAGLLNFTRGIKRRALESDMGSRPIKEIHDASITMEGILKYSLSVLSMFMSSLRTSTSLPLPNSGRRAQELVTSMLDTLPLTDVQRNTLAIVVLEDFQVEARTNCVALVLSSVVNNALRAMIDCDAPRLVVTVKKQVIEICDNGPGIPDHIMNNLMLDPVTTHAASGGTGLGLIFCKRIMQSFGGSISVASADGGGTTVTLGFPLHAWRNGAIAV